MTTAHDEVHVIKPIIVSHHHHQQQQQNHDSVVAAAAEAGSSPVGNNVSVIKNSLTKSSSSSFKRVSFGNSKGTVVETFIYESVPTIEEGSYYGPASPSGYGNQHRTHTKESSIETPPPLSKVKVTSLESQRPLYISPPSTVGSSSSTSGGGAATNNGGLAVGGGAAVGSGGVGGGVLIVERRNVVNQTSPLPSLQNMDEDSENPFRPDGRLSHEVEPIVESYKTRPFPVSTGSDFADASVISLAGSSRISPPSSPPGKKASTTTPTSQQLSSVAKSSKNGGGRESVTKPQDIKLTLTTADGHNTQLEVQHKQLTSPKAGQIEVVHIGEKKKRCGCCTIQ